MRIEYEGPAGFMNKVAFEAAGRCGVESYVVSETKKGLPFDDIVHVFMDFDAELAKAEFDQLRVWVATTLSEKIKIRRAGHDEN
jgi:hypothetical protein